MSLSVYLDALAGAEPAGALIEVRHKVPGGRGMRQVFIPCEERLRVAELVLELGSRTDLYVGVAPRQRRHGGRDAVEHVHVLWADCDGPAAVAALDAFSPAPSMVVRSGSGGNVHAYWPLWPPLAPHAAERANRRLAHALGADQGSTDAARILRPPGTFNHKGGAPRPVELAHLAADVFAASDVVGALPDPPTPRRELPAAPRVDHDDPLLQVAPPVYVEALTGREVGRDGKVRCPFHEDRTPSLHVYDHPDDGWCCFAGCGGGSIVDFASRLWGIEPRGAGYHELRRRLLEELAG